LPNKALRPAFLLTLVLPICPGQQEPHLRVDVGLVNVSFSVRDADGAYIEGLTRDDFEVLEDGVPQQIQFFDPRGDSALTVGLIEDFSDSQDHFNRQHRRDTLEFLHDVLRPADQAFVTCFGDHVRLVAHLTNAPEAIGRDLRDYDRHPRNFPILGDDEERHGGTALFDAIFFSARILLKPAAGRKALLVFSDGEDNSSNGSLSSAIEAAQGADSLVYAIRYTEMKHRVPSPANLKGIAAMKRLADETGGRDFDAAGMEMKDVFLQIGRELRSQYELAYQPAHATRDGGFRTIEIRPRNPRFRVRARVGYFAR
jgi:Ca-activated chloride channel family protein